MKRFAIGLCLLTMAVVPTVGAEEVLFVPLGSEVSNSGGTFVTRLWISNLDPDNARRVDYEVISAGADGTTPGAALTRVWTAAGSTRAINIEGGPGLVRITGAPFLVVSARRIHLDSSGTLSVTGSASLPVWTPAQAAAADSSQHLQGWTRRQGGGVSQTDFSVANFGEEVATCTFKVHRVDGTTITEAATVSVAPYSSTYFADALGVLNQNNLDDSRVVSTCDQPFTTVSSVMYPGTASAVVLNPAGSLEISDDVGSGGGGGGGGGPNDPQGDFVYLSDLSWIGTRSIQAGPHRDRSGFDGHVTPARSGYKAIQIARRTYPKGISWFGNWSRNSSVVWSLGGNYRLLTFDFGFDDEVDIKYEWALVDLNTFRFIRLQRPPDGWRGRERPNQFRVGAGGRVRIIADGNVIYDSPEIHRYSPAEQVQVDVRGVDRLEIELIIDAHEELNAEYRNGLTRRTLVRQNSWFDLINLGDPKLFLE